jgi:hypothetical protein
MKVPTEREYRSWPSPILPNQYTVAVTDCQRCQETLKVSQTFRVFRTGAHLPYPRLPLRSS